MSPHELTAHERHRVLGECLSELFTFVEKIKVRADLTEYEVHWLLAQSLTSRIATIGREEGLMP